MSHVLKMWSGARRRGRRQHGAIALATLAFMMTTGFVCISTLWGISYATGAYNTLYDATQSAAYAAAGQTAPSASGGSNSAQLDFQCSDLTIDNNGVGNFCTGGGAFTAAQNTLAAELPACPGVSNVQCHFGMVYATSGAGPVQLANSTCTITAPSRAPCPNPVGGGEAQTPSGIFLFHVQEAEAAAKLDDPSGGTGCWTGTELLCWQMADGGVTFPSEYESGVVVHTTATVQLPWCWQGSCMTEQLDVAVAAGVSQPTPNSSYSSEQ